LPDSAPVIRQIKRTLYMLVAATVVLYVVLGVLVVLTYSNSSDTNHALCALRGDLEKRVESSRTFLIEHPEGIPGIPAQTIRQGLVNQQHTIQALSSLSC
jgi:hypothetical protein